MENSSPNPNLSLGLITEILLRLPAKPLARFKCISKSWNSLIHSRHFILRHITQACKSLSTLHLARIDMPTLYIVPLTSLYPPFPPTPPDTRTLPFSLTPLEKDIFGSAHGLVGIKEFPRFLSLYNPTNKTFKVIPPPHLRKPGVLEPPIHDSVWHDISLGYDPLLDDYKVVMITQPNRQKSPKREVSVFSLKDPTWRKLDHDFPLFLAYSKYHSNGKYIMGNSNSTSLLLWVAGVNKPEVDSIRALLETKFETKKQDNIYLLVEFDLSTERFHVSELPGFDSDGTGTYHGFNKDDNHDSPRPILVVSGSDLLAQVEFGPKEGRVVEVWLRKGYGLKKSESDWAKLMRFPYMIARPMPNPKQKVKIGVRPVMVAEDGAEVLVLMEQMMKYFWVNVKSGEVRDIEIPAHFPKIGMLIIVGGCQYQSGGTVFVESLVELDKAGIEVAAVDPAEEVAHGTLVPTPEGR